MSSMHETSENNFLAINKMHSEHLNKGVKKLKRKMRNFSGTVRSHQPLRSNGFDKIALNPMHFGTAKQELLSFQEKTLGNIKEENKA